MPARLVSSRWNLSARRNVLRTIAVRSASGGPEAPGLDRRDGFGLIHIFRVSAHVEAAGELVHERMWNGGTPVERLSGPGGRRMGIQAYRQPRDRLDRAGFLLEQDGSLAVLEPFDPGTTAWIGKGFTFRAPQEQRGSAGSGEKRGQSR